MYLYFYCERLLSDVRRNETVTEKGAIEKIPKDLPIFFVAGKEDPVGNFGDGVEKVFQKYKDCGCKDVQIKLYENDRHEILNETDGKRYMQICILGWKAVSAIVKINKSCRWKNIFSIFQERQLCMRHRSMLC